MDIFEKSNVLVASHADNKDNVNCYIYDLKAGNLLASFKEGTSVQNGLAFICQDYLISAFKNEKYFKIWSLNKNFQDGKKMPAPGCVSALAVDNIGRYCVAAIDKSFYIWEIESGNLQATKECHSQPITCIRFSSDGSHFITGGKDGIVFVWLLSNCVSLSYSIERVEPRHTWTDHAAEVTDIFVGNLSIYARVATVSRDMTCRIYELDTGNLLTTVHVESPVTSVTMDPTEYFLYLGFAQGDIVRINLFKEQPANLYHDDKEKKCAYLAHSNEVVCLSLSTLGTYLASGSLDRYCIVWDVKSYSVLRKLPFTGPVTNCFISEMPYGLRDDSRFTPSVSYRPFKTHYDSNDPDYDLSFSKIETKNLSLFHLGTPDEFFDSRVLNLSSESRAALSKTQMPSEEVSRINTQLYSYALSNVMTLISAAEEIDD